MAVPCLPKCHAHNLLRYKTAHKGFEPETNRMLSKSIINNKIEITTIFNKYIAVNFATDNGFHRMNFYCLL